MNTDTGAWEMAAAPRRLNAIKTVTFAAAVVVLLVSAGCSAGDAEQAPESAPTSQASPPEPRDITCPSGVMTGTDGGEYQEENPPVGYATPSKAAAVWLAETYPRSDYTVVPGGLLVLREDGTVLAKAFFLAGIDGYVVHGYSACVPDE